MASYITYGFWVKELTEEQKKIVDVDNRVIRVENEDGTIIGAVSATFGTDRRTAVFDPDCLNVIQGTQSLLENTAIKLRLPLKPKDTKYFFVQDDGELQ